MTVVLVFVSVYVECTWKRLQCVYAYCSETSGQLTNGRVDTVLNCAPQYI